MNGDFVPEFFAAIFNRASTSNYTRKRRITKPQKQQLRQSPLHLLQVNTQDTAQQLNVSYKHQNGQPDLKSSSDLANITMNNETNDRSNSTSICNMCSRNDDVCINVQHNHATVLTVSDMTRLPSWNIREVLASVCSRCLVYVSTLTESSTRFRIRCEQAIHQQTIALAPPTPDTSPNNFLQAAIPLLDDTPAHSNKLQQRNRYAPGYCEDSVINDLAPLNDLTPLPHPHSPPHVHTSQKLAAMSRSLSPTNVGLDSMLEIHHERPVSPLTTESGGGRQNNKRSYQRVSVIPVQMICSHCNRAYWRKDFYNRHMRRCGAKNRYAQSLGARTARSTSRLDLLDAVSFVSEGNEVIATNHPPRIFRCNLCAVTVESIVKLREHKRIHLQRHYCDICSGEYTTLNEYEFHRAECTAKLEVFENGLANMLKDVKSPDLPPARHKTRSYTRALSVAPSLPPSRAGSCKSTKSPPAKKKKTAPEKIQQNKEPQQDDVQSTITNFVKRNVELYTDRQEQYEDDDDDVSLVDTLYSKRLSFTNHWVEEHSHSSHSHLSQGDNIMDDYDFEDIPLKSVKEYDLHLLDRLKVEVKLSSLTCFVPECKFTTNTLTDMMVHDYLCHFKKSFFYCKKCGYCFTSKVFLDYHLNLQNKGRYVCYKCGGHFEYQNQLDRHLIQHARQSEDLKCICHYCNYEFLDEDKLFKHCDEENHSYNKERSRIEIDHSMTISNEVSPKPSNTRRIKNKVREINMVLPRMPSKRCTPMEKYRPYLPLHLQNPYIQNRIGHVEFRYPSNPNCVGCL